MYARFASLRHCRCDCSPRGGPYFVFACVCVVRRQLSAGLHLGVLCSSKGGLVLQAGCSAPQACRAPRLSTLPQHRMPPTASFLEAVWRQAVRRSEAELWSFVIVSLRSDVAVACAVALALWTALRAAFGGLELQFGVAASAFSASSLPLALPQHTPAASHAADRFFLEAVWRAGGSGA